MYHLYIRCTFDQLAPHFMACLSSSAPFDRLYYNINSIHSLHDEHVKYLPQMVPSTPKLPRSRYVSGIDREPRWHRHTHVISVGFHLDAALILHGTHCVKLLLSRSVGDVAGGSEKK